MGLSVEAAASVNVWFGEKREIYDKVGNKACVLRKGSWREERVRIGKGKNQNKEEIGEKEREKERERREKER